MQGTHVWQNTLIRTQRKSTWLALSINHHNLSTTTPVQGKMSLNSTLASAASMTHPTLATCIALPIRACGSLLGSGVQRGTPAASAQSSKLGKPIMQNFSAQVSHRRSFDDQMRGDPVRVKVGNRPTWPDGWNHHVGDVWFTLSINGVDPTCKGFYVPGASLFVDHGGVCQSVLHQCECGSRICVGRHVVFRFREGCVLSQVGFLVRAQQWRPVLYEIFAFDTVLQSVSHASPP